jgi:hypothetical protein
MPRRYQWLGGVPVSQTRIVVRVTKLHAKMFVEAGRLLVEANK